MNPFEIEVGILAVGCVHCPQSKSIPTAEPLPPKPVKVPGKKGVCSNCKRTMYTEGAPPLCMYCKRMAKNKIESERKKALNFARRQVLEGKVGTGKTPLSQRKTGGVRRDVEGKFLRND